MLNKIIEFSIRNKLIIGLCIIGLSGVLYLGYKHYKKNKDNDKHR